MLPIVVQCSSELIPGFTSAGGCQEFADLGEVGGSKGQIFRGSRAGSVGTIQITGKRQQRLRMRVCSGIRRGGLGEFGEEQAREETGDKFHGRG